MRAGGQNRGAHQRERSIVSGVAPVLPRLVSRPLADAKDSLIPSAPHAPAHNGDSHNSCAFQERSTPHEAPPRTLSAGSPVPRCARNQSKNSFRAHSRQRVYTNRSPASLASPSRTAVARAREDERLALFASNEANQLRARWDTIRVGFVDEPRKAVQDADALVSAIIKRLAEILASERQKLEQQWDRSENISTVDCRLALQRYRSFFARLLAI